MWGAKYNVIQKWIYSKLDPQGIYKPVHGSYTIDNSYKKRLHDICNILIETLCNSDQYFKRWIFVVRQESTKWLIL